MHTEFNNFIQRQQGQELNIESSEETPRRQSLVDYYFRELIKEVEVDTVVPFI